MINEGGSVALCGAISQYDTHHTDKFGVNNTFQLVAKRLRVEGFLVFQFSPEQQAECTKTLAQWLQEGKLKESCTIIEGFDK